MFCVSSCKHVSWGVNYSEQTGDAAVFNMRVSLEERIQ